MNKWTAINKWTAAAYQQICCSIWQNELLQRINPGQWWLMNCTDHFPRKHCSSTPNKYFWNSVRGLVISSWDVGERTDLIVLFLASSTPMLLWGLGTLHSLFTGFQVMPLSDLMISVNYEIHASFDMRGLNCKIPRIYFKPSYMWTGGCCCSMEEIWQSVATSAAFFVRTHEIDVAAIFWSLLASLWSPLQHFFGDCVKTWLGTLVHILIDMDFKQQLYGNLNSHLQSLGCVKGLWCQD
jgi:hypothetical protein